jgi:hypothetical protein
MNWGKSIVLAFILFTIFIGTLVVVCMRQDISLVSKNYYQEELQFQQHINKLTNTEHLSSKPNIQVIPNALKISYPNFENITNASLTLFCPANAAHDKQFTFEKNEKDTYIISADNISTGMYKARFYWIENDKEYFIEEIIHI